MITNPTILANRNRADPDIATQLVFRCEIGDKSYRHGCDFRHGMTVAQMGEQLQGWGRALCLFAEQNGG